MKLLERIEDQISATGLPLVGITVAAVPCPDTPVILTLHWHGFLAGERREPASAPSFTPVPSSALQLNDRWRELAAVDRAAMEAAWALGAWDVARAERRACSRPGAPLVEELECLQAFGAFPFGTAGENPMVVADAPDAEDLLHLATERGYLMWLFRPTRGGLWADYADDSTLSTQGRRPPPCPHRPIPPRCDGNRKMVYRFGVPARSAASK
jgi:hypothetical protein